MNTQTAPLTITQSLFFGVPLLIYSHNLLLKLCDNVLSPHNFPLRPLTLLVKLTLLARQSMDTGVQPEEMQSSTHISNIIIIKFFSFDLSALMILSYNDVFLTRLRWKESRFFMNLCKTVNWTRSSRVVVPLWRAYIYTICPQSCAPLLHERTSLNLNK